MFNRFMRFTEVLCPFRLFFGCRYKPRKLTRMWRKRRWAGKQRRERKVKKERCRGEEDKGKESRKSYVGELPALLSPSEYMDSSLICKSSGLLKSCARTPIVWRNSTISVVNSECGMIMYIFPLEYLGIAASCTSWAVAKLNLVIFFPFFGTV